MVTGVRYKDNDPRQIFPVFPSKETAPYWPAPEELPEGYYWEISGGKFWHMGFVTVAIMKKRKGFWDKKIVSGTYDNFQAVKFMKAQVWDFFEKKMAS